MRDNTTADANKPLFEHADDEEALYAPQQLPSNTAPASEQRANPDASPDTDETVLLPAQQQGLTNTGAVPIVMDADDGEVYSPVTDPANERSV